MAVRMAPSNVLKELIYKTGSPIFMISSNQSGKNECNNVDEIEKICPTLDGMMEDNISFGKASTIIDCTQEVIKIQRVGPISMDDIIETLKN